MIGLNPLDIISEKRNIFLVPIVLYLPIILFLIPSLKFKIIYFFLKLTFVSNFRIRPKFKRFYIRFGNAGGSPHTEWHVLFREHIPSPILNPSPEMGTVSPGIHVRPTLSEFKRRQTSIQRSNLYRLCHYIGFELFIFLLSLNKQQNVSKYSLNYLYIGIISKYINR